MQPLSQVPALPKQPPSGGVLHTRGVPPTHVPFWHVPPTVQVFPPPHEIPPPSGGCVHPPSASQTSAVQGFPSSVQARPAPAIGYAQPASEAQVPGPVWQSGGVVQVQTGAWRCSVTGTDLPVTNVTLWPVARSSGVPEQSGAR